MAEPTRLGAALASLALPLDDPTEVFLIDWSRWVDDAGHPLPLPPGWRSQVGELVALGLTAEQVECCIARAMTAELRSERARFAYALAAARDTVKRSTAARTQSADPDAPHGEYVVNTGNGIVHTPTCRTLIASSPLNISRVTTTEGLRRCGVCFD